MSPEAFGWSLVGINLAMVVQAFRTHSFIWHHVLPLNAMAFKAADGGCTAISLTIVLFIRRRATGKGFRMNRLVVLLILVGLGLLFMADALVGQIPWPVAAPLAIGCLVAAALTPSRRDRFLVARWILRNSRREARFAKEHPELYWIQTQNTGWY